jgi:tetratricopeptide (TPR) repeat protein
MVVIEEIDTPSPQQLKEEGNYEFKKGNYTEALSLYDRALSNLSSYTEDDMRANLLFNKASCFFHLKRYEEAVKFSTEAITVNPNYFKAYNRRAMSYERLERFEDALSDLDRICELCPSERTAIESVRMRILAASETKLDKDKAEVMDGLKKIGNSILGSFGMSLDNFKMEKDPSTGSYSVKMVNPS